MIESQELIVTAHARCRLQERGISQQAVKHALQFGRCYPAKGDAVAVYLGPFLASVLLGPSEAWIEARLGLVLIVGLGLRLLTAYFIDTSVAERRFGGA